MDKKNISLFAIAIGLGAAGAGLSMLYLKAREADLIEALRPKSPPVSVVVAAKNLVKGDRLNASTLSIRDIPQEYVDNNAIRPEDFSSIENEVIIQNLDSGKPLLRSYVGREFPLDFSDTIPEKRRAMTIQLDETNSFSGLLRPGNRVDILVNIPPETSAEGKKGGNEIVPVLENVEVIATGRDSAKDYEEKVRLLRSGYRGEPDENFTTVTLNLTPKEAGLLTMAMEKGDLLALLRNRKDTSGSGFTGITRESLKQHSRELAAQNAVREAADRLQPGDIVRGEDGLLRTKDGKVLANQNLVVGKDGRLMTKSGIDLSGHGLSVDANGNLVTADGKVINPDDLVVGPDGTLMTKDGTILGGSNARPAGKLTRLKDGTVVTEDGTVLSGAKLNEDGKLVLADGTVVDPKDVVIRADGTVMTKDGKVLEGVTAGKSLGQLRVDGNGNVIAADGTVISGATLNKDGKLVLADGTVVDPKDVVVGADGKLRTKDGKVLEGVTSGKAVGGVYTDKDGNVVTADGTVIKGAKLRADGKLVLADGSVVDPKDMVVNSDGSVSVKPKMKVEGVTVRDDGKWVLKDGTVVDPNDVTINPDGTVTTKDGKVLEGVKVSRPVPKAKIEGVTVRDDGKWVLKDGTVVDPKDVVIHADGTVTTKDGKVLEGVKATTPPGSVKMEGVTVRGDGKWVLKDGTVVDPNDVTINPDGTVTTKDGKVLEGVRAVAQADRLEGVTADLARARQEAAAAPGQGLEVEFIPGASPAEGVLPILKLPVE